MSPPATHRGSDILVAWYNDWGGTNTKENYADNVSRPATLAVVDKEGNYKQKPTVFPYKIDSRAPLFDFPNGDVGWVMVDYNGRTIRLIRIAAQQSKNFLLTCFGKWGFFLR